VRITARMLDPAVLTATSQSKGNCQISTPHRIQTPSLTDYDKKLHN